MSNEPTPHIGLRHEGDVAIVRLLSREIRHPAPSQELSDQLISLLDQDHSRFILDFEDNRYLSSTAFAALFGFAQKVEAAGGRVKGCHIHPDVLVGAEILGLGRVVEIHDTEQAALDAFRSEAVREA